MVWKRQCRLCARVMSITMGFEKPTSRWRSRLPSVQAVSAVKEGKARELSMCSICSSWRGGSGMVGSVDILVKSLRVFSDLVV